jgi:hypothetical protein
VSSTTSQGVITLALSSTQRRPAFKQENSNEKIYCGHLPCYRCNHDMGCLQHPHVHDERAHGDLHYLLLRRQLHHQLLLINGGKRMLVIGRPSRTKAQACHAVNQWRGDLPLAEFINWCRKVVDHSDQSTLRLERGEKENDHGQKA